MTYEKFIHFICTVLMISSIFSFIGTIDVIHIKVDNKEWNFSSVCLLISFVMNAIVYTIHTIYVIYSLRGFLVGT